MSTDTANVAKILDPDLEIDILENSDMLRHFVTTSSDQRNDTTNYSTRYEELRQIHLLE